jgi:hypothetical protein
MFTQADIAGKLVQLSVVAVFSGAGTQNSKLSIKFYVKRVSA